MSLLLILKSRRCKMQYVIKDIKHEYGINLRIATIIALLIVILIFILSPNKIQVQEIKPHKQTEIISEDLPPELEQQSYMSHSLER